MRRKRGARPTTKQIMPPEGKLEKLLEELQGRGGERNETGQAAQEGRGHARNLTFCGSKAGVLWSSEVLGFTPTMLAHAQVAVAKHVVGWATGVWDGAPDLDTMQAALR